MRMVRRLMAMVRGMPVRLPLDRITSAVSMATSVPVPMAMPTSAWARAGASLMPSPTMPTFLPFFLDLLDLGGFLFRPHFGEDLVDAHLFGNGAGGLGIVAGEHDHFQMLASAGRQWPPAIRVSRRRPRSSARSRLVPDDHHDGLALSLHACRSLRPASARQIVLQTTWACPREPCRSDIRPSRPIRRGLEIIAVRPVRYWRVFAARTMAFPKGMLRALLHGCGQSQQIVLRMAGLRMRASGRSPPACPR